MIYWWCIWSRPDCGNTLSSGAKSANISPPPVRKVLQVAQFWKTVPFSRFFKEAALYEARYGQDFGDYCFQKLYKLRKLDIDMVVQILARNRHKVLKKTVLYTAYIILLYYCIILYYFVYHLLLWNFVAKLNCNHFKSPIQKSAQCPKVVITHLVHPRPLFSFII